MKTKNHVPVSFPQLPCISRPTSQQDAFWEKQSRSGAINAFRQLTTTRHRGGRKQMALPGGKLKPLFKNYSAPPLSDRGNLGRIGGRQALPGISTPPLDAGGSQKAVICGQLQSLPPRPPSTVRVYLASNYEDMHVERDYLVRHALPELQTFCGKFGLHFLLIDLCWGMTDVMDPHGIHGESRPLRQLELPDCQAGSLGPTFVALVGDHYGKYQVPRELSTEHFALLCALAKDHKVEKEELLETCYKLDENAVPPVYSLEVLDNVNELRELLVKLLDLAVSLSQLDQTQAEQLNMSVFAADVTAGVFNTQNPRSNCLCYRRELQQLAEQVATPDALNYINTVKSEDGTLMLDIDAQKRHKNLTENLSQHLGPGNYHSYYLKWPGDASSLQTSQEYKTYLENLCADFVADLKHLVVQGLEYQEKLALNPVFLEVLHHAHLGQVKYSTFQGQETLMFRTEKFLKDPRQAACPFIIHGPSSSGQSAAIAAISHRLHDWFPPESVVVTRYLGTTSSSCHIHPVIISITQQICMAYGLPKPTGEGDMSTLFKALTKFRSILDTVSQEYASSQPLFILLDGLSHLYPMTEQLHSMWAMRELPPNVHIIVAMTTHVGSLDLATTVVSMVSEKSACFELEPLTEEDAKAIMERYLESQCRTLTEVQKQKIINTFKQETSLLALEHALHASVSWKSFTSVEDMTLPTSGEMVFSEMLQDLEEVCGTAMIKHLLAYISVCGLGILEKELLDVLLCNSEVYTEMKKKLPILKEIIHFPSVLWSYMRRVLQPFVELHMVYGKQALAWKHQEYYSLVADRLGVIYPGINDDKITPDGTALTLSLHEDLSDRYIGKQPELPGIVLDGEAEGQVPIIVSPQPTSYRNVVKLHRLPMHLFVLLPVLGLGEIKREVFFNLRWLQTALQADSVHYIMKELQPIISLAHYFQEENILEEEHLADDLRMLMQFLQLATPALLADHRNLAGQITARLSGLSNGSSFIKQLVLKAQEHLESCPDPQLLAMYPCLSPPGCLTLHTLPGPTHLVGMLGTNQTVVTFRQGEAVETWNVDSGEQLQCFNINAEQLLKGVISTKNGEFILIGYYSHLHHVMELSVWSSSTGVPLIQSSHASQFECFCLDSEDRMMLVATHLVVDPIMETTQYCLLGIDNHTRDVVYTIPITDIHSAGISHMQHVQNIRGGLNGLVTIGTKLSKDLGYWDLESEEKIYQVELGCYTDHVCIHQEQKIAVCVSSDAGILIVVDLAKGEKRQALEQTALTGLTDMYLSSQGHHVLLATAANGVLMYSLDKGAQIKAVTSSENGKQLKTSKITMDTAECFIFVGYQTGGIGMYTVQDGSLVHFITEHASPINSLLYTSRGYLLSAASEGCSKVLNVLPIMERFLQSLDDSALTDWDGLHQFDNLDSLLRKEVDAAPEEDVTYPSDSDDLSASHVITSGTLVFTSSNSKPISVWDTATASLVRSLDASEGFSDVYTAYRDKMVIGHGTIPDFTRAKSLKVWNEAGSAVPMDSAIQVLTSCATPTEGHVFTISPSDKSKKPGILLGIYDLFEMKMLSTLHCNVYGHMDCTNLQLLGATKVRAEDGTEKHLMVLDYFPKDETSYFFSFTLSGDDHTDITMVIHEPLQIDTVSPQCTALLPEGLAVSGTVDGSLVIWTVETLSLLSNLYDTDLRKLASRGQLKHANMSNRPAHDGTVTCVSLASNSRQLVTGGIDMKVKIWDLKTAKLQAVLKGHTGQIECVSFSPDSSLVVSADADHAIILWKVDGASRLCRFYIESMTLSLSITPKNDRVIARVKDMRSKLIILKTLNV